MTKVRIIYNNFWRKGAIIAKSSQHPQFPAQDTQIDIKAQCWRSRYGTSSGNGVFVVDDNSKYINFDEGGSELTGTVVIGTYNGNTLATAIKTALNAAPGKTLTYDCMYSETNAKFTISAGSNFTLRWYSGTNKATDISDLCGFSDAADDTGASTYTSDYRRIHYPYEYISCDILTGQDINFIAILNHNFSSSAEIKIIGADDSGFTTNVSETTVTYNSYSIFFFFTSTINRRYWKLQIKDPTNVNSYLQAGVITLSNYWEPNRSYGKHSQGKDDYSELDFSDSMSFYSHVKPIINARYLPFKGLNESNKDEVLEFFEEVGIHYAFVICFDYDSPNSNSLWVRSEEIVYPEYQHVDNWNWTLNIKEVL